MNTIFREAVVETKEEAPVVELKQEEGKPIDPNSIGLKDVGDATDSLALWEEEKGKRFVDEIFNTHVTGSEFLVKMPTSEIDKYIRAEMEERGYEKTTKNYQELLDEIEEEIGSKKLNLMERFRKITGYMRVLNKIKKARELRKKYVQTDGVDS